MRYIPMSKFSIQEIEQQCRGAILKQNRSPIAQSTPCSLYQEVLESSRWENDVLISA
jgi:hypothetical protein